ISIEEKKMIISDLNYIETASEAGIEGGGVFAVAVDLKQNAYSKAVAAGGINNSAVLFSKVGSITANTNANSNASNNAQFSIR
ncbi:MAG: hypothetical protein ACRC2R_25180, partial [Xenococcaceae cyanobacterium]